MAENLNPVVYQVEGSDFNLFDDFLSYEVELEDEPVNSLEVFEFLRHINDPEHPLTLEQLNIISEKSIFVDNLKSRVMIEMTPTIPHCSMATLIGLCIRVKLLRSLSPNFKVKIQIAPGTHQSEQAINKQLNDKERVAAALENAHLLDVVRKCIETSQS